HPPPGRAPPLLRRVMLLLELREVLRVLNVWHLRRRLLGLGCDARLFPGQPVGEPDTAAVAAAGVAGVAGVGDQRPIDIAQVRRQPVEEPDTAAAAVAAGVALPGPNRLRCRLRRN